MTQNRVSEKNLNDVNSFNKSYNNKKNMITYFEDKTSNSKKTYKLENSKRNNGISRHNC